MKVTTTEGEVREMEEGELVGQIVVWLPAGPQDLIVREVVEGERLLLENLKRVLVAAGVPVEHVLLKERPHVH